MNFLKSLFWFLLAVIATVFAIGNWTTVPIKLWAGLVAEVNLPLLLGLTFLAGLLPTLMFHYAVRWRLKQRLTTTERIIADLRGMQAPAAAIVPQADEPHPPAPLALAKPAQLV